MFIAALFTLARTWKQPKCPSANEWTEYTHTHTHSHITMEYYSARKNNKIFTFAPTWIDLEDIMLSEIGQRKTNNVYYHIFRI